MPFDWLKSLRRRCIPRRTSRIRRRNTHLSPSTTPCEPRILLSTVPIGSEFRINSYTSDFRELPAIAMDSDGDFVATWASFGQDGFGWGVFAQRFNREGVPQGTEFLVNSFTTVYENDPAVAMDADGNFVIAWEGYWHDSPGSGYGVYAQRYNADGVPQGSEFLVNTYQPVEVTVDSDCFDV